ncbi:MBL fold metallo-hydrolase [Hahella ganghwensis]|uniref:MBL fold metallo-hydrolase n=1 Tax=Hahella ganghwensis TaxID=286420 RepID=UPI00035CC446|nr:MBL fold metallo-hydrolase [Hahella ganghwensis]
MLTKTLWEANSHKWIICGRDPEKPNGIIDTNQYMVRTHNRLLIMDPGGIELFSAMLNSALEYASINEITDLFASHQDPDIISSLGLWDRALPKARLHAPWLWEGFIRHFGMEHTEYVRIPDEGGEIDLGAVRLTLVPAHYLHSSGNFNVYDPQLKVLMSGDIGAALEPGQPPLFVEDFTSHTKHMEAFHRRWMPSNEAKQHWIDRIRKLPIEYMAPQHGRIFKGDDVKRFLDWFENLEVGSAIR